MSGNHDSIVSTFEKPRMLGPTSWKTKTSAPYAAATESRFITIAFNGTITDRKTSSRRTKLSTSTKPITSGTLRVI